MDTQETFTLLIWENVPDETLLYLIPNTEAGKYRAALEASHNNLINDDADEETEDEINVIGALIAAKVEYAVPENKDIATLWHGFQVDTDKPITDKIITAVYLTGFIL